jgi:FAD:protein FMN transferase
MIIQGEAQGTTFTVKYLDTIQRDLSREVDSLLNVMDRSLSLWDDASTVSRFNAAERTFTSDDVHFRTMVSLSEELWRTTRGAFDPTVLPLVSAYGLGREGPQALDMQAVDSLKELVGMHLIAIDGRWREQQRMPPEITYRKDHPGVQFDPNGIAQGYTVDVIAMMLEQKGITDHMVEVGGEVRARGYNDRGIAWTIQIDKPVEGEEHVRQTVVALQDRSLATSGNYRKFIEVEGRRFGHTIDPRSGEPAMNALLSATVIADNCAIADALATALLVMGPEESQQWLGRNTHIDAYLISDDGSGGYVVWNTPGWPGELELP